MKKILIIISCFLHSLCFSQNTFEFSQIDTLQGSKAELYVRANSWMSKTFNSSKSVIEMQDKEAGRIIAKAIIPWHYSFMGDHCICKIHYTITIDVKENKTRVVISDFYHEGCKYTIRSSVSVIEAGPEDGGSLNKVDQPWNGGMKKKRQKDWDDIRATAQKEADILLKSFQLEMKNPKLPISDF